MREPRYQTYTFKLNKSERELQRCVAEAMRRPQADMLRFLTWQAAVDLGIVERMPQCKGEANGQR